MATNNSVLYLIKYNNYYNRIVKKETNIADYPISSDYVPLVCNFNPADGIDTEHVMNVPYVANTPEADYVVVVSAETGEITSRWFIVNATRTRGGQYRMTLHRDLIADFYDAVMNAPVYVERGNLSTENPFIYNSENMSFNQIKTNEILLKDATQTPWVVAYVARDTDESPTAGTVETYAYSKAFTHDFEYSRADLAALGTVVGDLLSNVSGHFLVNAKTQSSAGWAHYNVSSDGTYTEAEGLTETSINISNKVYISDNAEIFGNAWAENINELNSRFHGAADIVSQQSFINQLNQMSGKVIKDTDTDTYYTITVNNTHKTFTINPRVNSGTYNIIADIITNDLSYMSIDTSNGPNTITIQGTTHAATITIKTVPGQKISTTIPDSDTRENLVDAPWDMLAIPYNPIEIKVDASTSIITSENIALSIAQELTLDLGKRVYDVQLLPYCPCLNYFTEDNIFDLTLLGENVQYIKIINSTTNDLLSIGFWCTQSSLRNYITLETPIINPTNPIEFKVNNECNMYRLVSPNYAGAFEFSATKNGGITGFEINCTYKPFQPYVHINPIFGKLYGKDFNDNRGLVCGGNFSMPSTENAWTNYQIQNKSYKESFDRQILNMETTYNIQRDQQKIAGRISAATAGISGATTGAMFGSLGGPVGGVIGGVAGGTVGAITSAVGLSVDLKYAEQLQNEALSYTKDQWNLSLQNIKALPNTIANVGAFDVNYKYFPFLEYYTCTDKEKDALRNKLKYNGMTVNAIGTLSDYQGGFVQGQLIRLESIAEDFHCAAAIANEIHKGVYI